MEDIEDMGELGSIGKGYILIPVLDFLKGYPWGDVAKSFVFSLRPSAIRFVEEGQATRDDSHRWRVTITVRANMIQHIEQEVEIGLVGTIRNGHDLRLRLKGTSWLEQFGPDDTRGIVLVNMRALSKSKEPT